MSDGTIPVGGTGQNLDASKVTREDASVVYRERVVLGDDTSPDAIAEVRGELTGGRLRVEGRTMEEILLSVENILSEMLFILKVTLK